MLFYYGLRPFCRHATYRHKAVGATGIIKPPFFLLLAERTEEHTRKPPIRAGESRCRLRHPERLRECGFLCEKRGF